MKQVLTVLKGFVLLLALVLLVGRAATIAQRRATTDATTAAKQFLASLTDDQRAKAVFPFDAAERLEWYYIPRVRKGLTLKDMTPGQRARAQALLETALSAKGLEQTNHIMNDLEVVLKEIEGPAGQFVRDPELYYFSVFGTPGDKNAWAWKFEGHHIAVNFTIVGGVLTAWTPDFLGANPAEVMSGPNKGLRVLGAEEDKAFQLLHALDDTQKQTAILATKVPNEIATSNLRDIKPLAPDGLPAAKMTDAQKKLLRGVISEFASRKVGEIAAERMKRIDAAGFDKVAFAWVGADELHQAHYYRIQGPTFLIEFDESQNNANHVHSVWRDFSGDFGADQLAQHYRGTAHSP